MSVKRIIVIGDVMLDVVVRPTGPVSPTSDTAADVRTGRGGSGANMAVVLAGAGHHVVYAGAAGDDAAGRLCADDLTRAGVRAQLETVDAPTGVVVSLVGADGQRSMFTDRGANRLLRESHVLQQLEEQFDHLHVSGYTVLDQATRATAVAALHEARSRGCSTSVDVCSVGPLVALTPEVFMTAIRGVAMLFANEEEALTLSGTRDVDDALDQLARNFDEVVVTRGGAGALARSGARRVAVQSQSVEVIDTTGAGDAATGTYLAARLQGRELAEALNEAMAASAAVVRGLGSRG